MVAPGLPVPELYAKVEDGVVTHVVAVINYQYIEDNPERYGDASLYVRTYSDNPEVRYGEPGMAYDPETGLFYDPRVNVDRS